MNILHTETLSGWGGQQSKVIKEIVATRQLGHTVCLLCNPSTPIGQRARELGFSVYEYPMNQWTQFTSAALYALRLIRELEIDVVITHSSSDSWMGGFAGRLSRRKPILMRERHNLHTIEGWPSFWLHRKVFHRLIAVSSAVRDYLVQTVKVPSDRVLILNSVVDVDAFDSVNSKLREELSIPEAARVFGMFSLLRVNKGIYDFLEVVKRILQQHGDVYAIFGGKTNPNRIAEFTAALEKAGVDTGRVRWTGFRQDVANVMKAYDVFVFPSHSEGWPNVLMEAMAAGLPLVAYDQPPMSDMVINGENGYTVPFGDVEAMAARTLQLLADSDERRLMGRNAYRLARQRHDISSLKDRIHEIFQAVRFA